MTSDSSRDEPRLRIVKGDAEPEELAAVVAAIAVQTAAAGTEQRVPAGLSAWGAYWHRLRLPARAGQGGWRASARPQ